MRGYRAVTARYQPPRSIFLLEMRWAQGPMRGYRAVTARVFKTNHVFKARNRDFKAHNRDALRILGALTHINSYFC